METELKQISLRINKKQLRDVKQYCLDNNTNMTTVIKIGLYLLQHSTQEDGKIKAIADIKDINAYTGLEL